MVWPADSPDPSPIEHTRSSRSRTCLIGARGNSVSRSPRYPPSFPAGFPRPARLGWPKGSTCGVLPAGIDPGTTASKVGTRVLALRSQPGQGSPSRRNQLTRVKLKGAEPGAGANQASGRAASPVCRNLHIRGSTLARPSLVALRGPPPPYQSIFFSLLAALRSVSRDSGPNSTPRDILFKLQPLGKWLYYNAAPEAPRHGRDAATMRAPRRRAATPGRVRRATPITFDSIFHARFPVLCPDRRAVALRARSPIATAIDWRGHPVFVGHRTALYDYSALSTDYCNDVAVTHQESS